MKGIRLKARGGRRSAIMIGGPLGGVKRESKGERREAFAMSDVRCTDQTIIDFEKDPQDASGRLR